MDPKIIVRLRLADYKYQERFDDNYDEETHTAVSKYLESTRSTLPLTDEDAAIEKAEMERYNQHMEKFFAMMDKLHEFIETMIIEGKYEHAELEYKIEKIRNYCIRKLK